MSPIPPRILIHRAVASLPATSMLPLPTSNLKDFSPTVADDTSQMVSKSALPVVILGILLHRWCYPYRHPFLGGYQSCVSEEICQNKEEVALVLLIPLLRASLSRATVN